MEAPITKCILQAAAYIFVQWWSYQLSSCGLEMCTAEIKYQNSVSMFVSERDETNILLLDRERDFLKN